MRLLLAEDDRVARLILTTNLRKWGHDVVETVSGTEALDLLRADDAPRLALLDWEMPGLSGVEVCRQLRASERGEFSYLIMLTARTEKQDIIDALMSGADDFLSKPCNLEELRCRIAAGNRIVELQDSLEAANTELRRLATTDMLTGVMNRRAIMERLRDEMVRSARCGEEVALIMCDIDYFKRINDTHGHACGDQVLVEVARRLQKACRVYDSVGRFGGEEFLIVLPGIPAHAAEASGERFLKAVNGKPVKTDCSQPVSVTVSMGMITLSHAAFTDPEAAIRGADALLYEAKHRGRNQVVYSDTFVDCS